MTVCLINVGHLDREDGGRERERGQRGNEEKFLADREGLFPHSQAPRFSPPREFHMRMESQGEAATRLLETRRIDVLRDLMGSKKLRNSYASKPTAKTDTRCKDPQPLNMDGSSSCKTS